MVDKVAPTVETPLSFAQQRLWVLDRLDPNCPQNVSAGMRLTGSLDIDALERALSVVASRHEILRSAFRLEGGEPKQLVLPRAEIPLQVVDLSGDTESDGEGHAARRAREESDKPFDLNQGVLVRALLLRLTGSESVLLITTHRLVCDKGSLEILLDELTVSYDAVLRGEFFPPSPALQYREVAATQSDALSAELAAQLARCRELLSGAAAGVDLPTDRPRPSTPSFRSERHEITIPLPTVERLEQLSKSQGVPLFVTTLTAFNVLLSRYSRQHDIVIGTSVSARDVPELGTVIGPLENTLVIRTSTSGDPSFLELLRRVAEFTREVYAHQNVPFELLVEELHVERDMSRNPLFQIMFNLEADPARHERQMLGLTVSPFRVQSGVERLDLSVHLLTSTRGVDVAFSYNTDLFDSQTIARMLEHFRVLLESVVQSPEQKISALPMLTDAERRQLLVEKNHTQDSYPPAKCIHQLFEEQVERTPDNVAVVIADKSLAYKELNRRANRLAHYLRKFGVGPDARVGICLERGLDMVVALLAVLKAGGAYVPLDPEYPRERLQFMLQDSAPAVLLTEGNLRELFTGIDEQVPVLDIGTASPWELEAETNPGCAAAGVTPRNVAYVIYTSGSTGTPKGVMVEHANVARLFTATDAWFRFGASDVWSLFHSYAFDFSVWEMWGALFYGGRIVIVPRDVARSPEDFYELLCRSKVTVLNQTPSAFRQLIAAQGKSKNRHRLRYIVFGGEALETAMLKPWYEQNQGQNTQLINMYGITETTVHVTYRPLTQADTDRRGGSPVGCRIPDLRIYILDDQRQPLPVGVVGELYVGGAGVARGYLNRPELTAARFLRDPFAQDRDARMYKTGDLGRWLGNGEIEFLGRNDSQVKIRGFRVELGEIEARLSEQAGVQDAVVIAREDTAGDKRLVAYYTTASDQEEVSAEKLRMHLFASLPDYMVPAAYVRLKSLPLTANGKLDRKALPVPDAEAYGVHAYEAPVGELERSLAGIWAEVLKIERVGRRDNFFALGGHSLMAGTLLSKVSEMTGRHVPLSILFRGATVESLAQLVGSGSEVGNDPVLMKIQHGESDRLPFFAIVPPGEEALGYAMLARHMGPDQTVYKVQAHAPVVRNRPYTEQEMDAMSQEYAAAVLAVQPEGPYCLGGMCDGTHIAERIILALEAQGRKVGLFAIFDTWPLQNTQKRWLWRIHYYQQRIQQIRGRDLTEQIEVCTRAVATQVRKLTGNVETKDGWPQVYWPKDFVPPRFGAPVALFKRPKQPFYYIKDPEMGWGTRSAAGVEIHHIPFDHDELLREPHVRTLGEELAACVERVSQQRPAPHRCKESSGASSPVSSGGGAG